MKCSEFQSRFDQLLDQREPPEHDYSMVLHAEQCGHCQNLLDGQVLLRDGLAATDEPEWSADFAASIVSQVTSTPLSGRQARRAWTMMLSVAALLLVGLTTAAFVLSSPGSDSLNGSVVDAVPVGTDDSGVPPSGVGKIFVDSNKHVDPSDLVEPLEGDLSPLHRFEEEVLPELASSFSGISVDSDSIPGVKPLKSSVTVAIHLLRRTLPGQKSETTRKAPTTSQMWKAAPGVA